MKRKTEVLMLDSVPDLFIIDRLLSEVDGIAICKHLKNQPATQHISIIIVSGSPDARQLSKRAGADDFIEKSFRMAVILNLVEDLLAKSSNEHKRFLRKTNPDLNQAIIFPN